MSNVLQREFRGLETNVLTSIAFQTRVYQRECLTMSTLGVQTSLGYIPCLVYISPACPALGVYERCQWKNTVSLLAGAEGTWCTCYWDIPVVSLDFPPVPTPLFTLTYTALYKSMHWTLERIVYSTQTSAHSNTRDWAHNEHILSVRTLIMSFYLK